jgi:hypothetical protein
MGDATAMFARKLNPINKVGQTINPNDALILPARDTSAHAE